MESYHQQGIKVRTLLLRVTLLKSPVPQLLGLRRTNRTLPSLVFHPTAKASTPMDGGIPVCPVKTNSE